MSKRLSGTLRIHSLTARSERAASSPFNECPLPFGPRVAGATVRGLKKAGECGGNNAIYLGSPVSYVLVTE